MSGKGLGCGEEAFAGDGDRSLLDGDGALGEVLAEVDVAVAEAGEFAEAEAAQG